MKIIPINTTCTITDKKTLEKIDKQEKIYNLSGGEQQRIALARVILKESSLILTDEPTGNLDPENSQKIFNILKRLNKDGKTIVMVTHNKDLAQQCDRIVKI